MMAKEVNPSTKKAATTKTPPAKTSEKSAPVAKSAPAAKTSTAVKPAPEMETITAPAKVAFEKKVAQSPQARYELISARAYALFERRGYVHGFDREDWLEAEKQLNFESLN
jgi:hypothetical protein